MMYKIAATCRCICYLFFFGLGLGNTALAFESVDSITGVGGKGWGSEPLPSFRCQSLTSRLSQCIEPSETTQHIIFQGIESHQTGYVFFDNQLLIVVLNILGDDSALHAIQNLDRIYGRHEVEGNTRGWPGSSVLMSLLQGDGAADGRLGTPSSNIWQLTISSSRRQAELEHHLRASGLGG
jgi:hypothetical protein